MEFITGRVVIIGNKALIKTADSEFSCVVLVIKKRMRKKLRNIAFRCYGRLADRVTNLRVNDKIEVEFFISSNQSKNPSISDKWYTELHAVNVDKVLPKQTNDEAQLKLQEHGDDTFKESTRSEEDDAEGTSGQI
jgi:hypothetical protein